MSDLVVDLFVLGLDDCRLLRLFLSRAVTGVTSEDPPTKPCHTQSGDKKSNAHPEPGRHPFAGEKDHACNYRQTRGLEYFGRLDPARELIG
jgi:hypothetical protein